MLEELIVHRVMYSILDHSYVDNLVNVPVLSKNNKEKFVIN